MPELKTINYYFHMILG